MPVLFSPKQGTSRIISAATVDTPSAWTAYFWTRRPSTTAGQFFSLGAGHLIDVYISSSTTDRLTIDRITSGTMASFQVTGANDGIAYSASQWVFVAMTQSGRATPVVYTASPVQAVALGTRTVTVANAGTGTETTTASQAMYLGNWSGFDYALGGDLAYFGFHNVVLTAGEIEEAMLRGMTLRGLVFATDLESTSKLYDLSGSARSLTNTGGADVADTNPPVIPLWIPTAAPLMPLASSGNPVPVAAVVSAASSVAVAAARRRAVTPLVGAAATVAAVVSRRRNVAAVVGAASSVVVSAGARRKVAPLVGAASSVVVSAGKQNRQVQPFIAAVGTVTAAAGARRAVAPTVGAISTVSVSVGRRRQVAPLIGASSSVVAAAGRRRSIAAAIAGVADVQALPRRTNYVAAGVDGASSVAVATLRRRGVTPVVAASSTVTAAAARRRAVVALIAGAGSVVATPSAPVTTLSSVAIGVYP